MGQLTEILAEVRLGNPEAAERLVELVHQQLHSMATNRLAIESSAHSLQPTDLVNEAWIRLMGSDAEFQNRRHFFGAAAEAMRRSLIDYARQRNAKKRYAFTQELKCDVTAPLDEFSSAEQLLDLNTALDALEATDQLKAEIVKLKFFACMKMEEIAQVCELSLATVERHWRFARVWLYHYMNTAPE